MMPRTITKKPRIITVKRSGISRHKIHLPLPVTRTSLPDTVIKPMIAQGKRAKRTHVITRISARLQR